MKDLQAQVTSPHNAKMLLAALLIFTGLLRGGVLWSMRENLEQDPDMYREIAENLLQHGVFAIGKGESIQPTAYRPPLYPILLSNLPAADGLHVSLFKVGVVHWLLGVATTWLTWLTARKQIMLSDERWEGPEGRKEIAKAVRSGSANDMDAIRSGGPVPSAVKSAGPPGLSLAAFFAGVVVACDPILLNQQALIMTETLAAFLAILSLWCLARFDANRSWFNAALAGGAIGLAALCRPTFLPWLGLLAMGMLLVRGQNAEFRMQNSELGRQPRSWFADAGWRIVNAAALIAIAAGVMSPWVIRNFRVFHKPIVSTTHGGYTFYLANNQYFYEWLLNDTTGLPWRSTPVDFAYGLSGALMEAAIDQAAKQGQVMDPLEIMKDRGAYGAAKADIEAHPGTFVWACAWRLGQLWSPLPHKLRLDESLARRILRYATCAWYGGVYVLALIGIWRLRWKLLEPPWIWGVLLILAFTAVHTFYWTNLRMRAPLMPFIAVVAAAALTPTRSVSEGRE